MSARVVDGIRALATSGASPFARADGAMRDDSRSLHCELAIVGRDADRDDPNVAGHRVTEITPARRAA